MKADGSIDPRSAPRLEGAWRWSGGSLTWIFEPTDGWEVEGVTDGLMIPFARDGVVVPPRPWSRPPLWSPVAPGDHWSVALPRTLIELTGARIWPTASDRPVLHPFGLLRFTIDPSEAGTRLCVAAWGEVDPSGADQTAIRALDELYHLVGSELAPIYRQAAEGRERGVDDEAWIEDNVHIVEEHYLRAPTPEGQSGKFGDAALWEISRRLVVRAANHDGTFLDVGCANGLLMESVHRWAAEDGLRLEPYGLDASARLAELARSRLPRWRERVFVGDALTWIPPHRFDFVHTMVDLVPQARRAGWLRRMLDEFVAPGGRLIVRDYEGIGERLRGWGLPVSGVTVQPRGDRQAQEAAWMDAPG
ncbi:MAG TPA: class I SAM-dependent methyltransferase [Candidatus Dormibacteraeota bacterium]|jgi:2-polyprenyl-3-methyl-5-hydroxy-6-metoxy-1,4-benzoquinol methylase|nr:class I SAM-dependent methyltransferase [Candidatus Dormibacteraeota bacterium]